MKIQQAIFTSSDRSQMKGYQLVAKSADIDRHTAQELHRWSPSQMGSDDPSMWTINYFPVSDDCVAVARTVLGGWEYSSRGGSQVVTLIAVLQNEQFAAYQNDAVLVAQTAMALGWLRLPSEMPGGSLGTFELPDHPFMDSSEDQASLGGGSNENTPSWRCSVGDPFSDESEVSLLVETGKLLAQKRRLVIVGATNPTAMVSKLIRPLSAGERRELSFTTGLPPALHRPFQVHFLPHSNPVLNQMFKSQGITLVEVPQPTLSDC